jgi:tetratricopeptide (TPR) repeat protein
MGTELAANLLVRETGCCVPSYSGMNRDEMGARLHRVRCGSVCAVAKWLIIVPVAASCFALGSWSQNLQGLFAQARQLQAKGDLRGAEDRYVQFLKLAPRSAEGHANLGAVLSDEGKIDPAVRQYETALRLKPSLYGVNLDLGIAYFREADYLKALAPLQKYLSARPASSQARELLGLSYTELDRYQEAIESLDPLRAGGNPVVLYALAACFVRLRKMDEAQAVMRSLLTAEPDSPSVLFIMGEIYVGLNQFPQALKEFQGVYSADPRFPQIKFFLGGVEERLEQYSRAEKYFRAALSIHPNSFAAHFALGVLLNKESRYDEAIPILSEAHRLNPGDADTLYQLALAEWRKGNVDVAKRDARQATKINPKLRPAHYLLGETARKAGDQGTATREFRIAESLSSSEAEHDLLRLAELGLEKRK